MQKLMLGLIGLVGIGVGGALAQTAADMTPAAADPPYVSALKSQLLEAVQGELTWRTNYINLQQQVGKIQAALEAKTNEANDANAKLGQSAATAAPAKAATNVPGGSAPSPAPVPTPVPASAPPKIMPKPPAVPMPKPSAQAPAPATP